MKQICALPVLIALVLLCSCDDKKNEREPSTPNTNPNANPQSAIRNPQSVGGNLERIQAAKLLRIGVKSDAQPFCFQDKDGNPQGFDVDLGARIARALGVQPLFVTVTSAERIEKVKNGEVDVVIATLTATRKRAREIDFSMPYFQDHQGLLVKADSPIQSYRDLSGKKVGAAEGSTSIVNVKVVAPDAEIVAAKSVAEAFQKLQNGEVDAITSDSLQLTALRMNSADPEKLRLAGEGFSVESYVVGLPQNDSQFRGRIDEVLTELWTNGTWTRLFNKWLGAESKYNMQAQFQMPILPP